jgi:hypothetical protein
MLEQQLFEIGSGQETDATGLFELFQKKAKQVVGLCDQRIVPGRRKCPVINGAKLSTADAVKVKSVIEIGRKCFELLQQSEPIQDTEAVWLKQFPARNRLELRLALDNRHGSAAAAQDQG